MGFFRFLFTRLFLRHLLLSVGVTLVLVWVVLMSLSWYTNHNEYIIVPDYRTLDFRQVQADPANASYRFQVIDSVFDVTKTGGSILSQDPLPGSKVKRDRMVYLTIASLVPEKTVMPELRDLTLRQAQSLLEAAGLKLGNLSYIRTFDEDAVQNQFHKGKVTRAGTEIDKGSVISLSVGMGARAAEPDSVLTDTTGL